MLIESNTFQPMFKPWSPMSLGSWALLIFGIFSFLSFLGALAEERSYYAGRSDAGCARRAPSACIIAIIGGLFGFYVAGYTGVLFGCHQSSDLVRHAAAGHAFHCFGGIDIGGIDDSPGARETGWTMPGLAALHRMDIWVVALELIVLIAVMVSLGPVSRAWLNVWGLLLCSA